MLTFYLSSTLMILGILQRVSDAKLPILEYYLSAKYARSWCTFTTLPIGNRNKSCLGFTVLVSGHHNIINISKYVLRKTWMTIFIRATKDKQSHEIRNIFLVFCSILPLSYVKYRYNLTLHDWKCYNEKCYEN